jgi:hypothetical protein
MSLWENESVHNVVEYECPAIDAANTAMLHPEPQAHIRTRGSGGTVP